MEPASGNIGVCRIDGRSPVMELLMCASLPLAGGSLRAVGFFGTFSCSSGTWSDQPTGEPFMTIDIHDSDIATVDYRPCDGASGRFYLGFEPRFYFDDPTASKPVDVEKEAVGFARWCTLVDGSSVSPQEVVELFAKTDGGDPASDFVEETVAELIRLAGLPGLADLPE